MTDENLVEGELVRAGRARMHEQLERRARLTFGALGAAFVAGAVLCAVFLHDGPKFSIPVALLYVAVYAAVSRVEFEIGTGAAVPTELVLVPMLFALPVGVVPALAAAALVGAGLLDRSRPVTLDRIATQLASASHTFGPVLVLGLAWATRCACTPGPSTSAALGSAVRRRPRGRRHRQLARPRHRPAHDVPVRHLGVRRRRSARPDRAGAGVRGSRLEQRRRLLPAAGRPAAALLARAQAAASTTRSS